MTNNQARECYRARIDAIQFDINCLRGTNVKGNQKSIETLTKAMADYQRKHDAIPADEGTYVRAVKV